MGYLSEALSALSSIPGHMRSFSWYSRANAATMTQKIVGSLQVTDEIHNVPTEYGIDSVSVPEYLYVSNINDGDYVLQPGDYLYESGARSLFLASSAYIDKYLIRDTVVVKDSTKVTTYTPQVDYTIDYPNGIIRRNTPGYGNSAIVDAMTIERTDLGTFSNTEIVSSALVLTNVGGVYSASGYYIPPMMIKNRAGTWTSLSCTISLPTGTTANIKLFEGTSTNAQIIAGTGVIQTISLTNGANTATISGVTGNGLKMKISFATTDTSKTPSITLSTLTVYPGGGTVYITYSKNKYEVISITNPGDDYHLITIRRAAGGGN